MSEPRNLHCYEYVTVEYEKVKDAFARDATGIFQRATASATSRAHELASTLRVGVGALEIGADVRITVRSVSERASALGDPKTQLEIAWTAATAAGLFPSMEATLSIYPLSAHETQLELDGRYRPPLGVVGNALDAVVGHRLAEASVLRFVQDVAARINRELGATGARAPERSRS
jgi:hypothetical protein